MKASRTFSRRASQSTFADGASSVIVCIHFQSCSPLSDELEIDARGGDELLYQRNTKAHTPSTAPMYFHRLRGVVRLGVK